MIAEIEEHLSDSAVAKAKQIFENGYFTGEWENVYDDVELKLWRQPALRGLYRYHSKVLFRNIPPYVLHAVNGDLQFRKEWDPYVLNLDVIDKQGDAEVVLWGCKFPWPMTNRDYVYARRCVVIPGDASAPQPIYVTIAKACAHPKAPETSSFVRVDTYTSICAFRAVDETTTECVTLYEDDMKGSIPVMITNYFTRTALPGFRTTLISACEKYMKEHPEDVIRVRDEAEKRLAGEAQTS